MKLRNIAIISIAISLLIAVGCATKDTSAKSSKSFKQYTNIVDADFVAKHITVPMAKDVMIIDARPKRKKYDKGHIPMAINIPHSKFKKMARFLPKNKNALLIYYCEGLKCSLSHKSAYKAEKLGYTNVKVYAKGFPAWVKTKGKYAQVPVEWIKKNLDAKKDMTIIDSRPKRKKYDKGHILTAISIPNTKFKKMTKKLPKDKSKLLVFYCGGFKCKLSHKSAAQAIALGYTNVKVFSAGYPAWKKFAKGSKKVAIKAGKEEGSISMVAFRKIMDENPASIYLIDVRDKDEFDRGTLKTAVNIPVDVLEDKIKLFPLNRPVVFICGTGARSGESYYMVKDVRPSFNKVYYVDAEFTFNKNGSFSMKKVE
ncbi:MAG: rhodanese-like domain-containing protein [Desulfobacterales bacterium]|nr:rhodanese-like domain-containing protein [Desulfobacterales bacterium]MCP4160330.1 rhodanese-like domain-containing protein [Deltaproteobacteria bacterium]